ncbi:hypothetical protein G5Y04_000858 [Vibrio parahaemolyticus]|nr:hypothetical protein [Vibrio parahaemolyticus]EHK2869329.1 hypothetical protein [Vibrio parahaemolyticus]
MKNWRDIKYCQDEIFGDLNLVYADFCLLIKESKHVTIANGDISIEYLSYKFNSKHCFVFNDSKPKIRVKFETTSLDDENLFFDIFLNRNGIIDTEYSKELNGHSLDLMKHENIESNLAKMIFGFFEKNKLLGE